jgi:hypothetical protein
MTLSRSGLAGPVELDGAFNWNDQRLQLSFHAGSSARLAGRGSPADFTIAGPYLSAAFSGQAALKEGLELAGTLQFEAEPLADLLSWAGHASAAHEQPSGAVRQRRARFVPRRHPHDARASSPSGG